MLYKKSFFCLLGTQSMANAADVLYIMALVSLIFNSTDSIITAILIPLLRMGAQMISGFFAPLLLVRYQLPFILFISQTGQLAFFTLLVLYINAAHPATDWLVVFSLVLGMSFLDGWTTPARNALVPRLATGDALMKANSMISVSDQTVQLAGWGLSGMLVAFAGAEKTLIIAVVLYAIAMLFTALLRDPMEAGRFFLLRPHTLVKSGDQRLPEEPTPIHSASAVTAGSEQHQPSRDGKWAILREGWMLIGKSTRLRILTFMDMVDMLGGSVWVGAFTLAFVQQVLLKDESWWGYINAAYFAGTIVGGLLVLMLVNRLQHRLFPAMLAGMTGYAILTILYAVNVLPLISLIVVLIMGLPAELAVVSRRTLIQKSVAVHDLPKVLSAQATLMSFTFCVSLLLMGWIAERFGIVNLYVFAGLLSGTAVLIGWLGRRSFARDGNTSSEPISAQGVN